MPKFFIAVLFVSLFVTTQAFADDIKESLYDRVQRTGTLRCGFFEENPFTIVDPNTNKKTGIAVELAETITAQLGLKLEWSEAVTFATLVEDLKNGRYDAICGSLFNIPRAGKIDYTIPFIYMPAYGYVRPEEKRFDNNLTAINDPAVTIAMLDGEGSTTIARRLYPKAKEYALPQMAEISQMLLAVAGKKADVAFAMPSVFDRFDKNNRNMLKQIPSEQPFYVFSLSFGIRPGEQQLKNMLDIVIKQLVVSGEMDRIIDKYEEKPGTFLRVSKPYK